MYCNNCGEKGHVFRSCPDPVISCGILFLRGMYDPLVFPVNPTTVGVLMVRRKDSMSYTEFIRGKYELHDTSYIRKQLANMTIQEQNAIRTEDFETLWTRLWGPSRDMESPEFELAKYKFNSIDRIRLLQSVPSSFEEPEWGFPKGRRMRGETDVQCAQREFFEETNISPEAYTIHEHITFTETFVGTNAVRYKHIYFLATMKDSRLIDLRQKFTPSQRREISKIDWKSLHDCKAITRPHYSQRKQMITELERIVSLAPK